MTFIKFNPDLMQAFIYNLTSYAEEAYAARSKIHQSSEDNDHPVPSVDDATRTLPAMPRMTSSTKIAFLDANLNDGILTPTMADAISSLTVLINNLEARRKEIIEINSNGIVTAPDGTMTYYLPDDGTEDTVANIHACNIGVVTTAQQNAEELQEASIQGTSSNGRTIDQILADIDKHRDNPIYGAVFVNTVGGAQAYLDLLNNIDRNNTNNMSVVYSAISTLGHVLGAASRSEVGGDQLGTAFSDAITHAKTGVTTVIIDDIAAFNALTSQSDVVYGTGFLLNAADGLEEVDRERVIPPFSTQLACEYSHHPLVGVLYAMGNNPEAALAYLSGNGQVDADGNWVPDEKTKQRWESLKSQNWDDEVSGEAIAAESFTAALAAASSYRNTDNATADAAATYISGTAIDHFSSDSWPKSRFTEAIKENLSVVVANSPEEIDSTANGELLTKNDGQQGPTLEKWGVNEIDISTLIYRFGDNKNAMATLATGTGNYYNKRTEEAMKSDGADYNTLANQYKRESETLNFIQGLSEMRFKDDGVASDDPTKNEVVNTALDVFTTLVAAGISAVTEGAAAPALAWGVGSTIVKPIVADALTSAWGVSKSDTRAPGSDHSDRLKAQAYADAANRSMLTPHSVDTMRDQEWFNEDSYAHPYVKPFPNASTMSATQIKSVTGWANQAASDGDPAIKALQNNINEGFVEAQMHLQAYPPNTK